MITKGNQLRLSYYSFRLLIVACIGLMIVPINGCQFLDSILRKEKKLGETSDRGSSWPVIDIDPVTGVQYYLGEEMVQNVPLPSGVNTTMVLLPGGEFIMGLNDEDPLGIQPAGNVRIAVNAFWMDQYEVTNVQYRSFLESLTPIERRTMMPDSIAWAKEVGFPWSIYFRDENYANYPVVCVTWKQANAFAEWAGKRLPAESEWEYAARSGVSGRTYPWEGIYARSPRSGDLLANFASGGDYALDGYVIMAPVGSFPTNNFRLYDMAGNTAEWTIDSYFPSYKILKRAIDQIITPTYKNENEPRKMVRGGSWASNDFFISVGVRDYRYLNHASPRIGFRLAMDSSNPLLESFAKASFLQHTNQIVNPNKLLQERSPQKEDGTKKKGSFIDSIKNLFGGKKAKEQDTPKEESKKTGNER